MKLAVKLETNNGWESRDIEIHAGNYVTALEVSTIHGVLLRIPFQITDDGMYVKREPYSSLESYDQGRRDSVFSFLEAADIVGAEATIVAMREWLAQYE